MSGAKNVASAGLYYVMLCYVMLCYVLIPLFGAGN